MSPAKTFRRWLSRTLALVALSLVACAADEATDAPAGPRCDTLTCAAGERCIQYATTWACVTPCTASGACGDGACCTKRDADDGTYCVDRRDPLGRGGAECLP